MPFPTAVIFLLVLFTTGMAALCVTGGLCLFAVRGVTGLRQIERSSQGELGKSHRKTKVEQSSQCSTA
jgi:hypothetical protein